MDYKTIFEKKYNTDYIEDFKTDINLVINDKLSSDDIVDLLECLDNGINVNDTITKTQIIDDLVLDLISEKCNKNITKHVILRMFDIYSYDKRNCMANFKFSPQWMVNLLKNCHTFTTQQEHILQKCRVKIGANLETLYNSNVKK